VTLIWDKTVFLQKLAHEFQRRPLVPPSLNQEIEDISLCVDRAPKVAHAAIDLEIDLIKKPMR
jgi:putative NIF3 family GTP cyclohydrolase 1 type 2